MAGNTFVNTTKQQLNKSRLHYLANPHIAIYISDGSIYITAEIIAINKDDIENYCLVVKTKSEFTTKVDDKNMFFQANTILDFTISGNGNEITEFTFGFTCEIYATSPD
jgi:hypothetical protein